ncbi:MAG TPA: nicotinate-nucleotide adenylyltransferase [Kouleothrix sp.]|jgi:nicotinate-nucleotide adenylyltransferase|nr:nicotinate-nucleotide adenylyltransferase [Kouleothrix sp.]
MSRKIGLLGGSFDPIHYGHLAIAEDARLAFQLDRILFIPAAQQPFKMGRHVASAEARLAMVQLACASNPYFEVSDVELQRSGASYTVTTLETLQAASNDLLFLLVGADSAADLPRWHAARRIVALARLIVIERPGRLLDAEHLYTNLPELKGRLDVLRGPQLSLSSTVLRQRAATNTSLRYLTPDPVVEYMLEHRLYSSGAALEAQRL